ncbi:MAG TPA: hypothetical protein VJ872_16310 [Nocardioides sp.]|nr:hypothetical protein [Nocardioides sp.]
MATERYDVVLLVEQELSAQDAGLVRDLHEGLNDQQVVYHLLLPMSDAAAAVEASMTAMGGGDLVIPTPNVAAADINALREECRADAAKALDKSSQALVAAGAELGTTTVVEESPLDALQKKVTEVDGREVIILTRPHLVAEFFHVDWTSRARRHLGVPVLHLLEHTD